ncbi:MAG: hypothetical protein ACRDIB_00675, partial [Ardenticatenaceae bacterium]
MKRIAALKWPLVTLFLLLPVIFFATLAAGPSEVARGKTAARPLTHQLDPEQQLAQELALQDPRVQEYTVGQRTEVISVVRVGHQFTEAAQACATADCRQVNIYHFDDNAAVMAVVNV